MVDAAATHMALIGFGEAAEAFAKGWGRERAQGILAWDEKCTDPTARALPESRAQNVGVTLASNAAEALGQAKAVFCLVTADRAEDAAQSGAQSLAKGAFWFDGNSCSPGAKRRSAKVIEAAGGRYVDVAIMAPVYPKMHQTPLLLAGPHAEAAQDYLQGFDMVSQISSDAVGEASAIKMVRSIMIKGMEALTAECLLAARRAGVEDRVLASLQASNPQINWPAQTAYNLERMMVHGRRRAAEMREVVATLAELDLPNGLASATVDWQQLIGDLELAAGEASYPDRADRILSYLTAAP